MTEFDKDEEVEDAFVLANPNPVLSSDAEGILQFINPAVTDLMHDVEVKHADDLLPGNHNGLVKACLATGVTLTEECQLGSRNVVWSYQSIGKEDVVHRFVAMLGGLERDPKLLDHLLLTDALVQRPGPERFVELLFLRPAGLL